MLCLRSHPTSSHSSPLPRPLNPAGPFCHRALLTLEEKHVPYTKTLIDFAAKPQWLLDVNPSGTVPVMKDVSTGEWIPDSGVIIDLLEAKYPEPHLGTAASASTVCVASSIHVSLQPMILLRFSLSFPLFLPSGLPCHGC
jgi:glutathione S-transferase